MRQKSLYGRRLIDRPQKSCYNADVLLVGHTDAAGGLEANIALSRRRAASVVAHLVGELGVSRAQVSAEGVGYLVPRASNLTDQGRAENRRVEVVLTSTQ